MYEILCGSTAEFYIQPLRSCIGDIDVLCVRPYLLALTDGISVLSHAIRAITDITDCFLIEPYQDYPAFIRLRRLGQIRYNWDRKILECIQIKDQKLLDTSELFAIEEKCTDGPAIKHQGIDNHLHDLVQSIWCPQWPKQAKDWPFRQRKYGWPTTAKIHEVVQNGCHVVFAKHPSCFNDIYQCRLSFLVAEVILLQSWTPVQQIVYHMLRFLAKRELIRKDCPKEDEVLSTYHFKTLMLWSCEEMSPEWWNSISVIKICCNLLQKLGKWLKEATCPNYFIPQANLFQAIVNPKIYEEVSERSIKLCDFDQLCLWFVKHYVHPHFLHIFDARCGCDLSRCVTQFMLETCDAMETCKAKSVDVYFSRSFEEINKCAQMMVKERCGHYFPYVHKYILRIGSVLLDLNEFLPSIDVESCFEFYVSTLLILNSAYLIDCTNSQYDSDLLAYLVRVVTLKPKFVASIHHIFPEPRQVDIKRSQLFFLKATGLMDNLTESSDGLESHLVSHMSKGLLRKALAYKDAKNNAIASATLTYLAALHFAASEYPTAVDLCSTVLISHKSTDEDKETMNAGCLYYIDDIVRIVGFYILFRQIKDNFKHTERHFLLDLRLTPEVFAHYLIISSNERTRRPLGLNYDFRTPTFPLDEMLMTIINRKSPSISKKRDSIVRVYQRTNPFKTVEALNDNAQSNKDHCIELLMEYSLETMTSFYNALCKDFGIHCKTVDCYRAAVLYKCRKYPEVLHICEQTLEEPDLRSDLKELALANAMVLPPLDSYFDRDIQCILGFHTLFYHLLVSTENLRKMEETTEETIEHVFAQKIFSGRKWVLSVVLTDAYSIGCHYFIGRQFLARYLKVRCLIDCNHSLSDTWFEFKKLGASLPFEYIIRCFLKQKLRQIQKGIDAKYYTS